MSVFGIISSLKYHFKSRTIFLIHSPFIYFMMKEVFSKRFFSSKWKDIEALQHPLKNSHTIIDSSKELKQCKISKKQGRVITRIVGYFQPKTILEIGSSLGIRTAYLSCEQNDGKLFTIETHHDSAKYAQQNFEQLSLKNIHQIVDDVDVALIKVFEKIEKIDLVYIDCKVTQNNTIQIFEKCIPFSHNDTIFILEGIHYSKEREEIWKTLQKDARITVSIDFNKMGCLFLRKESSKEDFILKTSLKK